MIGDVLPRERQFPCGWSGVLRSPSSEYGNLTTKEHHLREQVGGADSELSRELKEAMA